MSVHTSDHPQFNATEFESRWRTKLGFLEFFGIKNPKIQLIKNLIRHRIKTTPALNGVLSENEVDQLSDLVALGLPEGTIVTIVETWISLRRQGVTDGEIIRRIEHHRSSIGSSQLPVPLNLENYIAYRIRIEHESTVPVDMSFIRYAIEAANQTFRA